MVPGLGGLGDRQ